MVVRRAAEPRGKSLRGAAQEYGAATGMAVAALEWLVVEVLVETVIVPIDAGPRAGTRPGGRRRILRYGGPNATPATDEYIKSFHDPGYKSCCCDVGHRADSGVDSTRQRWRPRLEGPSIYMGATIASSSIHRRLPPKFRASAARRSSPARQRA
ncbi:MAG: hypothetical protein R2716_03130 [Microthrixaceae bacterium]